MCVFVVATVVRFCTTTHQTHENSSSAESSQVEGRAVVGRRVRDLVFLHGRDDLVRAQRAAAVLVDELEALPSRVQEIAREFRNLALRREGVELPLRRALGQLVLERDLDALLPARNVDR